VDSERMILLQREALGYTIFLFFGWDESISPHVIQSGLDLIHCKSIEIGTIYGKIKHYDLALGVAFPRKRMV
jgi:hypothetical protein